MPSPNLNNYNDNVDKLYAAPLKVNNLQNADKPTQTTSVLIDKNKVPNKGEFTAEKVKNIDETQPVELKREPPAQSQAGSLPIKSGKAPSVPCESGSIPSKNGISKPGSVGEGGFEDQPTLVIPDRAQATVNTPASTHVPANADTVSSRADTATPTASTSVPDPDVNPSTSSARSVGGSTVAAESDDLTTTTVPSARNSLHLSRRSIPSVHDVINLNRDMFMSETNTETSDPTTDSGFIGQLDDGFSSNIEYVNPRHVVGGFPENYTENESSTDTVDTVEMAPPQVDDTSRSRSPDSTPISCFCI